jgi:hypothetical protein
MNFDAYKSPLLLSASASLLAAGCGSPSSANIVVRKQNQDLQGKVDSLNREHDADQATIQGLKERIGTLPTLPEDRLARLFTTHGLSLGKLTGGADLDRDKPGDEGLKVYATPTDDDDDTLKAAGSFVVEAFDLAAKPAEIGKWTFDTDATRKAWNGSFLSHQYVLTCPWQTVPRHEELTVKVTFRDELTGREFHEQKIVKVKLPPTPTTAAAR